MKVRILAFLAIAAIPLMGFDCVTDAFTIALNLKPFNGTYNVNAGGNGSYGGSLTISPSTLYDNSYTLTGASVYDIRVSTAGAYSGAVSGTVNVNGILLFTYAGTWAQFSTPQSLLTSRLITRNQAGINELISAVVQGRPVVLVGAGTITPTPVPTGLSVSVAAYVQAYGHL